MRRVKTAAKKGDARTGAEWSLHTLIVPRHLSQRARCSDSMTVKTMRYLIAILALAGVVVSGLALHVHYSTETEPCSINAKWDCGIVNHSPFAEIAHIPVAAIGIAGYLV